MKTNLINFINLCDLCNEIYIYNHLMYSCRSHLDIESKKSTLFELIVKFTDNDSYLFRTNLINCINKDIIQEIERLTKHKNNKMAEYYQSILNYLTNEKRTME